MAVVQVKRSDLTGTQGEDNEFGRLVVRKHPAIDGAKVLDVLPQEVSELKTVEELVELEYTEPGAPASRTLVVTRTVFDALASDMAEVLKKAPGVRGRRPGNRS